MSVIENTYSALTNGFMSDSVISLMFVCCFNMITMYWVCLFTLDIGIANDNRLAHAVKFVFHKMRKNACRHLVEKFANQ